MEANDAKSKKKFKLIFTYQIKHLQGYPDNKVKSSNEKNANGTSDIKPDIKPNIKNVLKRKTLHHQCKLCKLKFSGSKRLGKMNSASAFKLTINN